jgi:pimeloyl-ACP methyl ester carboxylesterase
MADVWAADGVRLYAEAHGDGPPVVFSCAFCTTCENFRPQVDPLVRAGFRAVLWDYRGHGRSDAPHDPAAYSPAQVVDDLARVVEWAAPGVPAVVGGLSFGGLASLHLALAQPARVRALFLLDSGPGFKNADAQLRWLEQVERSASFLEAKGCAAFVASKAAPTLVGRNAEAPAARAAAKAIAAQDAVALALFGRRVSGPAPGVIDDLPRIAVPALVLVGEEDAPYRRAAEVMAAKLPKATLEVIPGAGHIVNLEAGPAFDRALLRFLEGLGPA